MADYADRVKDTTTTTGTGSITLSGTAPTGFRAFASAFSVSDRVYYCISSSGSTEWEVGYGTLSGTTTLARTTIIASSNSGSAVSFSAGTKDVFCDIPAQAIKGDVQTFTSSGTWIRPSAGQFALVRLWGAGGSGAKGTTNRAGGGGGGGGYSERIFPLALLGSTETVTIGAGGPAQSTASTNGTTGGNSTFGAYLIAFGGERGTRSGSGSGNGGAGGAGFPVGSGTAAGAGDSGDGGSATSVHDSSGGGGGSGSDNSGTLDGGAGGVSYWGGGGGGGASVDSSPGAGAGGTSTYGGAGGAGNYDSNAGVAGTVPGGGGGGTELGTSGAGADGKCIVYVF